MVTFIGLVIPSEAGLVVPDGSPPLGLQVELVVPDAIRLPRIQEELAARLCFPGQQQASRDAGKTVAKEMGYRRGKAELASAGFALRGQHIGN